MSKYLSHNIAFLSSLRCKGVVGSSVAVELRSWLALAVAGGSVLPAKHDMLVRNCTWMVYIISAHVCKLRADNASEIDAEEATKTGLRADNACSTNAGAEISEWAFFLPYMVYFSMTALWADDLAATSFTATSFKEAWAFTSFFLALIADLKGMERKLESKEEMGEIIMYPH